MLHFLVQLILLSAEKIKKDTKNHKNYELLFEKRLCHLLRFKLKRVLILYGLKISSYNNVHNILKNVGQIKESTLRPSDKSMF